VRNLGTGASRAAQRQDLIALNMLDLTMPVADEAPARFSDVVVFMRCIPLLNQ
jgi:hypothetical protein